MNPLELFSFLKDIEKELGRTFTYKWGPREIDLDLLLYNDLIYEDEVITIPHPGILERDFVIIPLCELNSDIIHPVTKKRIIDCTLVESKKVIIKKCSQDKNKEVEYFE